MVDRNLRRRHRCALVVVPACGIVLKRNRQLLQTPCLLHLTLVNWAKYSGYDSIGRFADLAATATLPQKLENRRGTEAIIDYAYDEQIPKDFLLRDLSMLINQGQYSGCDSIGIGSFHGTYGAVFSLRDIVIRHQSPTCCSTTRRMLLRR